MKKLASLLLAVLMICTMIPLSALPAFAEDGILSETVEVKNTSTIILSDQSFSLWGYPMSSVWIIGDFGFLQIFKINNGYRLVRIEANVTNGKGNYEDLELNYGKIRESGAITIGDTMHVDFDENEDNGYFQIRCKVGKSSYVSVDKITVYYEKTCEHEWENSTCSLCGRRCSTHDWHNGICTICGKVCYHKKLDSSGERCSICKCILGDEFVCSANDNYYSVTDGRYFCIKGTAEGDEGWKSDLYSGFLCVEAKKGNGLRIKRIEAKVVKGSSNYNNVHIDGGIKRESQAVDGDVIHIDDVHSTCFSMYCNTMDDSIYFDDIAVYFECIEHEWEEGECVQCRAVCEHEWTGGKCTVCGTECSHKFVDECCTVCGELSPHETLISYGNSTKAESDSFLLKTLTIASLGWVIYDNPKYGSIEITAKAGSGKQIRCIQYHISYGKENFSGSYTNHGTIRETGSLADDAVVHIDNIHSPDITIKSTNSNMYHVDNIIIFYESANDSTGSVLSEGSLTIIVGIAAAVVFGLGGFFIGKKKKKTEQ